MEKIVLGFSKDTTAEKIKNMLYGTGYEVMTICHSKAEIIRSISEIDEVLVIMSRKLPDATADSVYEDMLPGQKLMVIVKADAAEDIENPDILILPLPITKQRLISSMDVFMGVIEKRRKSGGRNKEDEEIIKKAKLFLMETYMMTEEQAHRFIQKRSMDSGSKFIDTAKMILNI